MRESGWVRRLWMAAAIVLVAAAIWLWGAQRQAKQSVEVHELIAGLCDDLAAGRDPAPRMGAVDPLIARQLIPRLQSLVDRKQPLTVLVTPGDTDQAGNPPRPATHTAVIRINDAEVLGIRVEHRGKDEIAILGFWDVEGIGGQRSGVGE